MKRDSNGRFASNRNLAKISYKETADGKIKIIGFDGFLSMDDIERKYGAEVERIYRGKEVKMERNGNRITITSGEYMFKGEINSKKYFEDFIKLAKKAGQNLVDAIREVRKAEEKPVKVVTI